MNMEKENLLDISVQRTALKERFANEPTRIVEDVETLSLDPDIYLAAINAELGRAGIVNKNGRIYRVDEFLPQNEQLQARIDAGAEVDAVDNDGKSALHKAALNGHSECVRVLMVILPDSATSVYHVSRTYSRTLLQHQRSGGAQARRRAVA